MDYMVYSFWLDNSRAGMARVMIPFLQSTWFLWWALAVVGILRWFHQQSADGEWEDVHSSTTSSNDEERTAHGQLASRV